MARPKTQPDRPVGYFRQTAEEWAQVDMIAKAEGKTRSAVLAEAVRRYVLWWNYERAQKE